MADARARWLNQASFAATDRLMVYVVWDGGWLVRIALAGWWQPPGTRVYADLVHMSFDPSVPEGTVRRKAWARALQIENTPGEVERLIDTLRALQAAEVAA